MFLEGGARLDPVPALLMPERPARPERPLLLLPRDMPRRSTGVKGRIALLHALAHIELNAIDLALDMAGRFYLAPELAGENHAFVADWLKVGEEEARHFLLLAERLQSLGAAYGDLPAHDGLWSVALETASDVAARLAIAPLVHEARGLDVTPGLIRKLRAAGDETSARVLDVIYAEEIGHVATGWRWFNHVCAARHASPGQEFLAMVNRYHRGGLKPPFNATAREKAGLLPDFYLTVAQKLTEPGPLGGAN
ncbi:MAG: ferritin-like domain-containing protein [Alphaproteobacteria bacterium]|nr:ferritin-like domain-containing protein [Alphaproteobacteria bacterium]